MPSYESPSLYIDFSRLPPPAVIEDIEYEALLRVYRDQVLAKNPKLDRALSLEQSGANIILQAEAYGEMIMRARVNAAARAVMLPFATGTDLDNLASFYGLTRDTIPGDATANPPILEEPESDDRFRRRVQMAPESFATAGSEGAYIYHALTAHPKVRDATATKVDNFGGVRITIMNSGTNPNPTDEQIEAVYTKLNQRNIKPLTDVVSVAAVSVKETVLEAELILYPGPNASLVMADVQQSITALRARVSLLGRDLTRAAIYSALMREGVQSVNLITPATDIVASPAEAVWITSANITVNATRTE
jgi:phage-related baseplate assembly protein